jgi:hypothetical protein
MLRRRVPPDRAEGAELEALAEPEERPAEAQVVARVGTRPETARAAMPRVAAQAPMVADLLARMGAAPPAPRALPDRRALPDQPAGVTMRVTLRATDSVG